MLRNAVLAIAASSVFLVSATDVNACLNAVQLETKEATKLVAKVEATLDEGRPKRAFYLIPENPKIADRKLGERLQLLTAVARLRIGHVSIALSTLQFQYKQRPDDPYTIARLAEAQTAAKKDLDKALVLLTDLEKRDVMPDAEGWATLARLYDQKADSVSRDRALRRCKQIAKRTEVCAIHSKVVMR